MKTLRIIAFTFLLPVFFSYAMDMITLSNMCSDICGLKRLRAQGNEVTFNGLPIELRTNIVNNYFLIIEASKNETIKKGLQLKALCVDKKIRYIECTGGIFSFIFFFTWAASPFFGKMIGDIMFPVGLVGQGIGCGMYHLPYPFV